MGFGRGSNFRHVKEENKWDYVNLDDFRTSSCLTFFSYIWLWFLIIVAIAVFSADVFTAVNLLAFDRWASQVKPAIPFAVSKWIFAVCILLSFVLIAFEWLRAFRVIRRGGVADSYLDPLAFKVQSIRPGTGKGWRRFLVFTKLTKSKSGVDYIALFAYFEFKGAIRLLLAEGPRQVVNAVTLWSVLQADLLPAGDKRDDRSTIVQFLDNVKVLANQPNKLQVVILFSMLFTLVIWVLTILCLAISIVLYLIFLWHYIPSEDGTLSNYCRRKIDSRVEAITAKKAQQALEKQEAKRRKHEVRDQKKGGGAGPPGFGLSTQPTLPQLDDDDDTKFRDPTLNRMDSQATLNRMDSQATLPLYTSRPGTAAGSDEPGLSRQPTLPDLGAAMNMQGQGRRGPPRRADTFTSAYSDASYGSGNAPLLGNASDMGYSDALPTGSPAYGRPLNRSLTGSTQVSDRGMPIRPPPTQGRSSPGPSNFSRPNLRGNDSVGPSPISPLSSQYSDRSGTPAQGPAYEMSPVDRSNTPASSAYSQVNNPRPYPQRAGTAPPPTGPLPRRPPPQRAPTMPTPTPQFNDSFGPGPGGYRAYSPAREGSPPRDRAPPPRNFTSPAQGPPRAGTAPGFRPPQRSATMPIEPPALSNGPVPRAATAGPGQGMGRSPPRQQGGFGGPPNGRPDGPGGYGF